MFDKYIDELIYYCYNIIGWTQIQLIISIIIIGIVGIMLILLITIILILFIDKIKSKKVVIYEKPKRIRNKKGKN